MNKKDMIGSAIVVVGIFAGIYFGLWLMCIGGIIDVINDMKSSEVEAAEMGIGIFKIILGWLMFIGISIVSCVVGFSIID